MIAAIGEILCDLIGSKEDNSMKFVGTVGGAPLNVASNLAYLGAQTMFYGVVGDDIFGDFINKEVKKQTNLNSYIKVNTKANTSLAVFLKDSDGDGSFQFMRNNGADYSFETAALNKIFNLKPQICHFGSLFLSSDRAYKVITKYASKLNKHDIVCSFDVNYRDDIFENEQEAVSKYLNFIKLMDVVKFAEKEIMFLSNTQNLDDAIEYFSFLKIFFITLGSNGSMCVYKNKKYYLPGENNVKVVDAIGAGDSFYSGILYSLQDKNLDSLTEEDILDALTLGNKCGAKAISHQGATGAYKSLDEAIQ